MVAADWSVAGGISFGYSFWYFPVIVADGMIRFGLPWLVARFSPPRHQRPCAGQGAMAVVAVTDGGVQVGELLLSRVSGRIVP